ncbi:MAG TPA: FAD-binding protein [Anaerolineaceae bacterium]|nr:FAD-binding protein [Anaerolineaceae bacterium]
MKKEDQKKAISRRDFLRGTATGAASIAAATMLGGCAKKEIPVAPVVPVDNTNNVGAKVTPQYEVINTDVLIIGSGFGGTAAAYQALADGKKVTIIDKGPFRHSGGWGYNWDVISTWVPDKTMYSKESYLSRVVNQELYYKATSSEPIEDMGATWLDRGQFFPTRNEDGSVAWYIDYPFIRGAEGVFPRHTSDHLAKSPLVTVIDRTMITDLFINNGRCIGAMGIYLPTGDFRVFRAPVTVVCTGPATWWYGWNTVSANTFQTPDNTGDVEMAALRHGAGIGDSEYASYDFATTYPQGLAYGWGTILNPDANEYFAFSDKDGKQIITEESGLDLQRVTYDRTYFNTELAKLMLAGAMTKEGGLLANLSGVHLRRAMTHNLSVFEKFGIDPKTELLPIHDEIYERNGAPVIDDNMMSEDITGVFFARGAGVSGTGGGPGVNQNTRFGAYAMRTALEFLNSAPAVKEIDWSPVETEFARIHELRTRQATKGLRPHVVRHNIQKACGECMGILRETKKLEAAAKELARIRKEELPNMIVTNPTLTFNNEWKEAIENYNLLASAELAVNSTLTREESRGTYLRPEFPNQDDENWKCMLVGKLENGEIVFSKKTMPEHIY